MFTFYFTKKIFCTKKIYFLQNKIFFYEKKPTRVGHCQPSLYFTVQVSLAKWSWPSFRNVTTYLTAKKLYAVKTLRRDDSSVPKRDLYWSLIARAMDAFAYFINTMEK